MQPVGVLFTRMIVQNDLKTLSGDFEVNPQLSGFGGVFYPIATFSFLDIWRSCRFAKDFLHFSPILLNLGNAYNAWLLGGRGCDDVDNW
jgi:hypothetical protein